MDNFDDYFGGLTEEEYVEQTKEHFEWIEARKMNNLTDAELMDAMECCFYMENCNGCPLYIDEPRDCLMELGKEVYNRFNYLKAKEKEQQAEIEKLQGDYSFLSKRYNDIMQKKIDVSVEELIQAKSEAYMELADELKRHCLDIDSDNINEPNVRILWDAEETIDGVLKDMMEGNK